MFDQQANLHKNESGQVAYSTLFILLFLVVAAAVFTISTPTSTADIVQQILASLAMALVPVLIIASSALWLFGKSADDRNFDLNP